MRENNARVTHKIEWRCPKMRLHISGVGRGIGRLPVPCKECYSVKLCQIEEPIALDLKTINPHNSFVEWDKEVTHEAQRPAG